jgi:hypothetical protein
MRKLFLASRFAILTSIAFVLTIVPSLLADGGANHHGRNLHFGVSGGNINDISRRFCCSGTLGSLVQSGSEQYILSNNHVLGRSDQAASGEDISQPGLIDNNCQVSTVVADFTTASPLGSNVDAALAQLRPGLMDGSGFIEDIGTISSTVKAPVVGLAVAKSGRTTGFTTASIGSINTSVSVRYSKSCGSNGGPIVSYTNQVVINSSTFSAGGDSGSLIVSNNSQSCHQPVALLFAGSSTTTIGNPIGEVLAKLSNALGNTVSFVGGPCTAFAPDQSVSDGEPSAESINQAMKAMRSRETDLMSRPGVIGVGIGGPDAGATDASIVVYIDVNSPNSASVPRRINGVRVRKVFTEPFIAY